MAFSNVADAIPAADIKGIPEHKAKLEK